MVSDLSGVQFGHLRCGSKLKKFEIKKDLAP